MHASARLWKRFRRRSFIEGTACNPRDPHSLSVKLQQQTVPAAREDTIPPRAAPCIGQAADPDSSRTVRPEISLQVTSC